MISDSGRRTHNLHPPTQYDRRLCRIFYLAAQTAMCRPGASRDYYRKKRAEGKVHSQAVLCLARRRVDVLWAMLREQCPYLQDPPPGGQHRTCAFDGSVAACGSILRADAETS